MKRITLSVILALLFCSAPIGIQGQEKKMTRQQKEEAWRAERLRKRAAEEAKEARNDSIEYMQAIMAIKNGSWALEASSITFNNGATNFVTESTNFISVNSGNGVLQTAFDNSNIYSPNGMGGITLQGNISEEELSMDQEGNLYYSFNITGAQISATVNITLTAYSNQATATIDPNFSTNDMTMSGYIYPYDSAGIFEGSPSY